MSSINVASSPQNSGVMQSAGSVDQNAKPGPAVDLGVVSKSIESTKFEPSEVGKANQPTREVVAKAAEQLQSFVKSMGRNLSFSVDQTTGYHVVRVVNPETNEVIRQLPSEELLRIAQNMASLQNGLVSQKA